MSTDIELKVSHSDTRTPSQRAAGQQVGDFLFHYFDLRVATMLFRQSSAWHAIVIGMAWIQYRDSGFRVDSQPLGKFRFAKHEKMTQQAFLDVITGMSWLACQTRHDHSNQVQNRVDILIEFIHDVFKPALRSYLALNLPPQDVTAAGSRVRGSLEGIRMYIERSEDYDLMEAYLSILPLIPHASSTDLILPQSWKTDIELDPKFIKKLRNRQSPMFSGLLQRLGLYEPPPERERATAYELPTPSTTPAADVETTT